MSSTTQGTLVALDTSMRMLGAIIGAAALVGCSSSSDGGSASGSASAGGAASSSESPSASSGSGASASGGSAAQPEVIAGYGAVSVGGTGGDVCTVTNLDDAGQGSLRACVTNRDGPRIVEFAVGGTITLATDVIVNKPFLTIDGATAPAPGITIEKVSAMPSRRSSTTSLPGCSYSPRREKR